ncbi:MAG TPA: hypothetical protein VGV61_09685, partial [Thermoanaerobaculia bacterium]|nr:hypothetical protein [Thermoanaerobaculia bacterium]
MLDGLALVLLSSFAAVLAPASTAPAPAPPPWAVVLGIAQDGGYPQAGSKDAAAWDDPAARRLVACLGLVDPLSGERFLI